ncbi:hypothetical protein GIB67_037049 [Kingdonia uniflora]|uniref:Uncharacterized protein n=1 Tax=Kingdonia uniflora TaxID=39325 RepID=A0A7J7LHI9_9MAGN|nr:hypothetical protein GIB67_037049 [Kingdonia uniflora]
MGSVVFIFLSFPSFFWFNSNIGFGSPARFFNILVSLGVLLELVTENNSQTSPKIKIRRSKT